jgi:hypothetical protein
MVDNRTKLVVAVLEPSWYVLGQWCMLGWER